VYRAEVRSCVTRSKCGS